MFNFSKDSLFFIFNKNFIQDIAEIDINKKIMEYFVNVLNANNPNIEKFKIDFNSIKFTDRIQSHTSLFLLFALAILLFTFTVCFASTCLDEQNKKKTKILYMYFLNVLAAVITLTFYIAIPLCLSFFEYNSKAQNLFTIFALSTPILISLIELYIAFSSKNKDININLNQKNSNHAIFDLKEGPIAKIFIYFFAINDLETQKIVKPT
jgi:hypothetical protein